ncbi:MAG: DNRLRE domain-containing protein [Planctomycetes bacterium]|nr:DNRLRE domain-containing protein [Planctomycetota bacterium]HPF13537.1 DNRLRE domain-containing protein [Planctomycetota bacterium]HRV80341.1 DNRLRE domain-containing protein [Planctomycetota bacterium]
MNRSLSQFLPALALGFLPAVAFGQTVVLTPQQDNTLYFSINPPTGTLSNGSGTRIFCGATQTGDARRMLLQFDIASAIPAGSTINSVTLNLTAVQLSSGGPVTMQTVHRVTQAWGEGASIASGGQGGGTTAVPGDATWLHAMSPSTFWTTAGGDFDASPSATMAINAPGSSNTSSSTMASDVQGWLDTPVANFGWLIKDTAELPASSIAFSSREGTQGPTLTVDYTAPANIVSFCDPADNNSTGFPTVLQGTLGSGIGSGLHLEASQGPPTQFGYFLVGTASTSPGLAIGSGHLCLSTTAPNVFGRYNIGGGPLNSVGLFDAGGVLQNLVGTSTVGSGFDVPATLPLAGNPAITAGSTWHFQLWHRENAGDSNLSNGLSVTF